MWQYNDGMGWLMIFGGFWMIVFWGLVIWFIIWGVKKLSEREESEKRNRPGHDAVEIARQRYARGEITREQFEQIKKDLT